MSTLRERLQSDLTISDPFQLLKELAAKANSDSADGIDESEVQELILYAAEKRDQFGNLTPILDSLLRSRGLYPYMHREHLSPIEAFAYEAHRTNGLDDIVLHQEQAEVYLRLLAGENVILSAPTSFGKSLLIDALLAANKYADVAVIVPTIALIDETRRRLAARFSTNYKIITHASQERAKRNVYVLTQERLLDFDELPPLDLFVIDEFYKLDPRRDSERALLLNHALYKLLKTGAQFYMLGPNIEALPNDFVKVLPATFISTSYSTVVTELVRVDSNTASSLDTLITLCRSLSDPTLIYCASPAGARRVAVALMGADAGQEPSQLKDAYDWVADNFHPDWAFSRGLLHGIGIHHGRIPRSLAQYAVRSFNEGALRFLVCTSTLIEGVNTKAKNVIVYDNRVAQRKFDFFTFNNIRGRSGRMFEHFVGRVYLFNAPPQDDLPLVDVPLLTQSSDTPESFLIQLDEPDLNALSLNRTSDLREHVLLDLESLRKSNGIDPRAQIALAEEIAEKVADYYPLLAWTGIPNYDQLKAVCELIWRFFVGDNRRRSGVSSGSQLAYKIDRFRRAKTIKKMILTELAEQEYPDADAAVEDVLDFTRNWAGFHFPRYLMAVDRIQRRILLDRIGIQGDYSVYASLVENMFTTPGLVALDEYGIPLPIAEKIAHRLGKVETVDEAINSLRRLNVFRARDLTSFESNLVVDAQASLGEPMENG